VSEGRLRSSLGAASAVATAGVAAYQHPTVKTVVNQGLTKVHQFHSARVDPTATLATTTRNTRCRS